MLGNEISRYIVAGGIAFVADFAALWFCKEHLGVHYLYGNVFGYVTGLVVSYTLNVLWVFEYRRYRDFSVEFTLFTMIVLAGLCLSVTVMYLLVSHLGINYLFTQSLRRPGLSSFSILSSRRRRSLVAHRLPSAVRRGNRSLNSVPEPCPNCGGGPLTPLYRAPAFDGSPPEGSSQPFTIARCSNCALVLTPGVTDSVLQQAYAESYYGAGGTKFTAVIEAVVRNFSRRRAAALIARWRARGGSGLPRVLDIGCGRGTLLSAFHSLGAQVLGMEREAFPVPKELEGLLVSEALADARFDAHRFDIIVIWRVLEHVQQVDAVLAQAVRHLNPGGLLVVAVPNFESVEQQHAFGRHWFHLDLPRHLAHIESGWLQQRMHGAGLKLEVVSHLDLLQNIYGFIQSVLNVMSLRRPNELYDLLKAGTRAEPVRLSASLLAAAPPCLSPLSGCSGGEARRSP